MSDLMTVTSAAEKLGLTPQALYLAIKERRLASVRVFGRIVIPRTEYYRLKKKAQRLRFSNGRKAA